MARITPKDLALGALALLMPTVPGFAAVEQWSVDGPWGTHVIFMAMDSAASVLLSYDGFRFYRSADGARSWSPAIDPRGPDSVVSSLVGVPGALYFTYHHAEDLECCDGAYRSVDGGETWTGVGLGLPDRGRFFEFVAVGPDDPDLIFGKSFEEGLYRSKNGGSTWVRLTEGLDPSLHLDRLWIAPSDSELLFLSASRLVPGPRHVGVFLRSADGGDTWQEVDGLGLSGGEVFVNDVAIDPESAALVYLLLNVGLYRSADGGESFEPLAAGLAPVCAGSRLHVHPVETSRLYLVDECQGLYRSTDAGQSWVLQNGLEGFRISNLLIDPSAPHDLYVSTFPVEASHLPDSVYRSSDDGASFVPAYTGIGPAFVFDFAADLSSPSRLYAVSFGQLLSSTEGSDLWASAFRRGSLRDLAVDPHQGGAVYLAVSQRPDGGIYRSTDGGVGWSLVLPDPDDENLARTVAVDPVDPRNVYAGFSLGKLFYSRDGGETWSGPSPTFNRRADVLAVDRVTQDVFAGAGFAVYRSTDLGETWSSMSDGSLPDVQSLAVRGTTRYAGGRAGLSRWDEATQSWIETRFNRVLGRVGANALALTPTGLYVGARNGVFRSTDQGESFRPVDHDRLGAPVHALAADPRNPGRLFAGSDDGLYEIEVLPDLPVMSLQQGRFEVEVVWQNFEGGSGPGLVAVAPPEERVETGVALRSRDSAVAQFFAEDNWEVLVKVLDGLGVNRHYWVFFAAATNVGYTVTVTDTVCGTTREYVNPRGVAAPAVTDVEAFPYCLDPAPGTPTTCVADANTFCLGPDGRFRVEMIWTDFQGRRGRGHQVRLATAGHAVSDDSGLFYFFTKSNWELMVKVLDGCRINGHYWFFSAATTNVGYKLKVKDTVTGQVRLYENPLGHAAAATTDTIAFATCGSP